MSVLNKQALEELILQADYSKKLVVTPLLSQKQIGPGSIDIRLGSSIIVPRRTFVASHDVTDVRQIRQVERRLYERVRLKYHSEFILFKGCLTLELANLSDSPIALYPGLLIGQLVFFEVKPGEKGATGYQGRYDCPTEAGLPQFFVRKLDDEMTFWGRPEIR